MKKVIVFLISLAISINLFGVILGLVFSNKICERGLFPVKKMVSMDFEDKAAYYTALTLYPAVRFSSSLVNSVRNCEVK